ncbi:GNAT family N-acyltransferase [Sediminitomix flava]|nr:GNAT family N-acyltransferase [Sediminitomix flava]
MEIIRTQDVAEGIGFPTPLARLTMNMLKLDQFNKLYSQLHEYHGIELLEKALDELNISLSIDEEELKFIPKDGAFITISNHPFGLLDGVLLLVLISKIRPDFKVTANYLLSKMDPFKESFISVNPFGTGKKMKGSRIVMDRLSKGHPVGIFPAGEVSTYYKEFKQITDKAWSKSAIRMIKNSNVPVIPIYFEGNNSLSFHLLGQIHPVLRTARIPSEFLKKKNSKIRVRIGSPISPKEQDTIENINDFGRYLRARTYILGTALSKNRAAKVRDTFQQLKKKPQPIIAPVDHYLLEDEIEEIRDTYRIHEHQDTEIYIAPYHKIPHLLTEIGRLREESFRAVGEGTNKSMDLDEFDRYYQHLFLWNKTDKKIMGAYRIGLGDKIMTKYGVDGFYLSTLFHLDPPMKETLEKSLELGRSFVAKDYQRKPLSLFLLWKGILLYLQHNPQYKHLIGPVSISNNYSQVSKSFLISFIRKHYFDPIISQWVRPRKAFAVNFKKTDSDILTAYVHNLNSLDKLIENTEPQRYRVPILLKQYLKQNARIAGFNIDPNFNNSLDGLLFLNVNEIPEKTIQNVKKEVSK